VNKKLYLIRGLPGSGKSTFALTLANAVGAYHFEADHYFEDDDGNYNWDATLVHAAHRWCQHAARHIMSLSRPLVISNTFTTEKELKPYLDLAASYRYHVTTLIVEGRHGKSSIHDVPRETIDKMRNRFSVKL
jgi:predicted kinase